MTDDDLRNELELLRLMQLDSIKRSEREERNFQRWRGAIVRAMAAHTLTMNQIYSNFMDEIGEDETSNGEEG